MSQPLDLEPGPTQMASVHDRIFDSLYDTDGDDSPERRDNDVLEGDYHPLALRIVTDTWRGRMAHEYESAAVFSGIVPQLMDAGASIDFETTVLRCAMDELRHATLCKQVVEFLGGESVSETDEQLQPVPRHTDCTARVGALRNLLYASLTETVSMGLLTEERERVEEPYIARVLRQLASDESLHARVGWTYLADCYDDLSDEELKSMRDYLPVALGHLEAELLETMTIDPDNRPSDEVLDDIFALGFTESRRAREVMYDGIREVVLPRLDAFDLDATDAWQNRLEVAPTG